MPKDGRDPFDAADDFELDQFEKKYGFQARLAEEQADTRKKVVAEVLEVLKAWGYEPGEYMVDAVAELAVGPRERRKAARLSVSEINYGETESERMYRLHPIRMRWEDFKMAVSEWWHS